jgi:hypothetical protein
MTSVEARLREQTASDTLSEETSAKVEDEKRNLIKEYSSASKRKRGKVWVAGQKRLNALIDDDAAA